MRNAFQAALLLGTFFLVATAQDSVTITSDPRDLSHPISSLINQIRQREKVSVTYEDPRYLNPADTEDVTAEASKGSELEKAYGPRMLVPKGHPVTFVYAPARMNGPGGAKATIERMLQEYASVGGPVFAAIGDDVRLHVVPREVLDPSGTRVCTRVAFSSLQSVFLRPGATAANSFRLSATKSKSRPATKLELAPAFRATIWLGTIPERGFRKRQPGRQLQNS
jgi:hypothetical protein